MRTIIAFLVAPLIIAVAVALLDFSSWGFGAFLALFYGYPAMLLVGIPSYFFYRRKGWLTWQRIVTTGGVVGGLIPAIILGGLFLGLDVSSPDSGQGPKLLFGYLAFVLLGAGLGSLSAYIFWLIAIGSTSAQSGANMPPNKPLQRSGVD